MTQGQGQHLLGEPPRASRHPWRAAARLWAKVCWTQPEGGRPGLPRSQSQGKTDATQMWTPPFPQPDGGRYAQGAARQPRAFAGF